MTKIVNVTAIAVLFVFVNLTVPRATEVGVARLTINVREVCRRTE